MNSKNSTPKPLQRRKRRLKLYLASVVYIDKKKPKKEILILQSVVAAHNKDEAMMFMNPPLPKGLKANFTFLGYASGSFVNRPMPICEGNIKIEI